MRPRYTLSAHISKSLFAGSGRFSQITSHIFKDSRDMAKEADEELKSFCSKKENCRRSVLVKALGSREQIRDFQVVEFAVIFAPLASVWNQNKQSFEPIDSNW